MYNLVWNMESQRNYRLAIPLYEKALSLAPEDAEIM
jgi:hypothetical protein